MTFILKKTNWYEKDHYICNSFFVFYMLKRINIVMIICLLGFFLVPAQSYACKSHAKEVVSKDKSCCSDKKHHSENHCEKDCCKSKDDTSKECSGNCGPTSCHSSSNSFSATPPISRNAQNNLSFENKKSYPLYKQHAYSSGESSIWQPPKIG